ncbi:epsin-3-like [Impatiens glandulifera]|uniref:epsin-3-like n=1 Tax=Impatiens glandulifera TaxID=253017 RepID=UPI001FB17655|nr:epsin-3-like [Impatiens glandulifera]
MENLLLDNIKKQASCFLNEKYKDARLVFTDVTRAELLAEEATNDDPSSPNASTMTRIADASFHFDDYWRIADMIHKRLYNIDWKHWRQSYKTLVLLDFLLTHGPEQFADEFRSDYDVIHDLGAFQYKDEKGFDWGMNMRNKSDRILELLQGGDALKQARLKALKITREIHGFGNDSPCTFSPFSDASRASSFSSSATSSPAWSEMGEGLKERKQSHLWDCPPYVEEAGSSLIDHGDEGSGLGSGSRPGSAGSGGSGSGSGSGGKPYGLLNGICSKLASMSPTNKHIKY